MKEAIKWLRGRGLTVEYEWAEKKRFKRWFITSKSLGSTQWQIVSRDLFRR